MAKLGVTTTPFPADELFAGTFPRREKEILVEAGQNVVRGQVMAKKTSTGKYVAYVNGGADGTGTPVGILGTDVEATGGDVQGFLYVTGEFNQNALTGFEEAGRTALEALNCYVMIVTQ